MFQFKFFIQTKKEPNYHRNGGMVHMHDLYNMIIFIINLNMAYDPWECAVAISLLFQSTECKFIQQSHEVIAM